VARGLSPPRERTRTVVYLVLSRYSLWTDRAGGWGIPDSGFSPTRRTRAQPWEQVMTRGTSTYSPSTLVFSLSRALAEAKMESSSNRNNTPSEAMDQLSISDNTRIIVPTSTDVVNDIAATTETARKTRTTVVINPLMEQNNDSNSMPLAEDEQLYVCNGSPPIDNLKKEAEFTCCEEDMVGITSSEKESDYETNHGSTNTKETATVATSLLLESLINTNSNGDHSNSNILFPPLYSNGISQEVEEGDECTPSVLPLNTTVGSTDASTMLSMSAPPDFFYRNHNRTMTSLQQQQRKQQNMKFIDPLNDNAKLHPFQLPFSNCSTIVEQETIPTTTNTNTNTSATSNQATTTENTKSPLKKESLPLFVPSFTYVSVSDPRYVTDSYYGGGGGAMTTGVGFFSSLATGSSYWVYTVTSTLRSSSSTAAGTQESSTNHAKQLTIHVQRRFRHFDALQDRLREVCPGSILPARYVVTTTYISTRNYI